VITRSDLLELFCCLVAALTSACSQSNNLFLGEVRATAGSHKIVVTDCYRLSVDPPRETQDGYRYMPCRDAEVVIRNGEAIVNGRSYGQIGPNDSILVDHGRVSVGPSAAD
jgi:hypothetical protein